MSRILRALILALLLLSLLSCACGAEEAEGTQLSQTGADETEPTDIADGALSFGDFEYRVVQQRGLIGFIPASVAVITAYRGDDARVEVPEEIEGMPVRGIAAGAFKNNASLRKLVLPQGTELQDGAFDGCVRLSEVEFSGEGEAEPNPAAFTNTPYGLKLLAATQGIDDYELPGESTEAESAPEGGKTRGAGHTVGVIAGIIIVVAAALAYFVVLPKAREKAQNDIEEDIGDDGVLPSDDTALKNRKNLTESADVTEDETVSDSEIEQSAQKSFINELRAKGAARMAEAKARFDTAAVKTRRNLQSAAEDAEAAADELGKDIEAAADEAGTAAEEAAATIDEALSPEDDASETKTE